MLELFSRKPDVLQLAEGSHLTPLPMEDDVSSLRATSSSSGPTFAQVDPVGSHPRPKVLYLATGAI